MDGWLWKERLCLLFIYTFYSYVCIFICTFIHPSHPLIIRAFFRLFHYLLVRGVYLVYVYIWYEQWQWAKTSNSQVQSTLSLLPPITQTLHTYYYLIHFSHNSYARKIWFSISLWVFFLLPNHLPSSHSYPKSHQVWLCDLNIDSMCPPKLHHKFPVSIYLRQGTKKFLALPRFLRW